MGVGSAGSAAVLFAVATLAAPVSAQTSNRNERAAAEQSAFWRDLKQGLTGPNTDKYWDAVHGALIPPRDVHPLRGTVVSSEPTDHPRKLVVAMSDDHTPEVTLTFTDDHGKPATIKEPVAAGTIVEFGGMASEFQREPFMLTFEVNLGLDPGDGLWIFRNAKEKERQK